MFGISIVFRALALLYAIYRLVVVAAFKLRGVFCLAFAIFRVVWSWDFQLTCGASTISGGRVEPYKTQ